MITMEHGPQIVHDPAAPSTAAPSIWAGAGVRGDRDRSGDTVTRTGVGGPTLDAAEGAANHAPSTVTVAPSTTVVGVNDRNDARWAPARSAT